MVVILVRLGCYARVAAVEALSEELFGHLRGGGVAGKAALGAFVLALSHSGEVWLSRVRTHWSIVWFGGSVEFLFKYY